MKADLKQHLDSWSVCAMAKMQFRRKFRNQQRIIRSPFQVMSVDLIHMTAQSSGCLYVLVLMGEHSGFLTLSPQKDA